MGKWTIAVVVAFATIGGFATRTPFAAEKDLGAPVVVRHMAVDGSWSSVMPMSPRSTG